MDKLIFNPVNGFLDASAYPDPNTETQVREQLMSLHSQAQEYLNGPVYDAIVALQAATGDPDAIQEIMDAIATIQDFLTSADALVYMKDYEV